MNELQCKIIQEIYKAVEGLGGNMYLLAAIGSWGDTLDDEDVLELLEDYNK